jgi:hypothetical protein
VGNNFLKTLLNTHHNNTFINNDGIFTGVCLAIEDNAQQKEASVGMDVDMLSDVLNYFPDNDTIVAEGNAQIRVKGQNTVLQADKITFHRDTQIVVAEQNVKIIKNQMTMSGSYIKMDLSKESALVDHPVTQIAMIHIQARDATLYSDNIEALKGNAQVSEKMNLVLASSSFDQFHDTKQEMIDSIVENADYKRRTQYKIKTKEMIIKADEYKNNITLKTADVYVGKRKIATIPSITFNQINLCGNGNAASRVRPNSTDRDVYGAVTVGSIFLSEQHESISSVLLTQAIRSRRNGAA